MRNLTCAAWAAMFLLTASAWAGDAMGTIASIDAEAQTITLVDGTTYVLPAASSSSGFEIGQRVTITYELAADGRRVATKIGPGV